MSNIYKFSDIAELKSEKINVNTLSVEQYITTDNMLPNLGGVEKVEKLPNTKRCNSFKKGDILFSNIRTYFRKVWLAEFDGGCSADVLIIKSKNERILLNDYLYLIICSNDFIAYTVASSNGSKMPRGSKAAILQYEFSLPDIEEQRKIVKFFFALKDKISINNKTNQTLEQIAQAIFKSWFIDFDPVKAKIEGGIEQAMAVISGKNATELHRLQTENHTAYRELHQLANAFPDEMVEVEGFGQVPRGWEVIQFKDCVIESKLRVGELQGVEEYSVGNTGIYPRKDKYKKQLSKTPEKNKLVKRGGLVFGMGSNNVNWGIMDQDVGSVSPAYYVYDLNQQKVDYRYLKFYMKSYETELQSIIKPTSRQGQSIDKDYFLQMKLYVPYDRILSNFLNHISEIYGLLNIYDNEIETLSSLRDELLLSFLNGDNENG